MNKQEEEEYRMKVRSELEKKQDDKAKDRIRREEEARADGGTILHGLKSLAKEAAKAFDEKEK